MIDAIAAGDESALRALYERHAAWLLLRLERRCPDHDLVEETLQDTFQATWRGAHSFRGTGEVGAWLWGIAIRRMADSVRKRGRWIALPARPASEVASPQEEFLRVEMNADLAVAMASLSPELREVLQATALDGLTTREAARLLGLPVGTVKTRMMRARAQLQRALA